jgi:uncharacterized protein
MKEFLEFIFKEIVSKPETVTIAQQGNNEFTTYLVTVDSKDMALAIGKGGRTIKSIRDLARSKAIKDNVRINVELVDSETLS